VAEQNGQTQQWNRLYFDEWVAREGLDLIRGYKVDDVYTVPLKPWARRGGYGVQIQLDGTGEMNAAYVCEIPPGQQLAPERHVYEEIIYVLKGRGSTSVWLEGKRKNSFEWGAGSLFAIPLNAWAQHYNGSGSEPARYLAVTTAPIMMNLIRNEDFIFNNPAAFPERYAGEDDYFSGQIDVRPFEIWDVPGHVTFSNLYADINNVDFEASGRGVGTRVRRYELANGIQSAHVLEVPGGTFSKPHRHGPGAHVLWMCGEGYSLLWPDGGEKKQEFWGPGTMLVPPSWWWHQHCVASREPAQHLALKLGGYRYKVNRLSEAVGRSTRAGGSQMDYEDFPPGLMEEVSTLFAAECAKRGTPVHMESFVEA
jgi:quercetin dioxygenase-like cupin family protein